MHAGQRLALYSLPTLCFGVGCREPGAALFHWTLAGTATTPPPAPLVAPFAHDLLPSVFADEPGGADTGRLDVFRVSMEALPGESGRARCDAKTELCGHRWLGAAGPAITAKSEDSVQRVYAADVLDTVGELVPADAAAQVAATAPALVGTVLVEETSADTQAWRLAVAAVAVVVTALAAMLAAVWAARSLSLLRTHSRDGDGGSISSGSDGADSSSTLSSPRGKAGDGGAAVQYAWALHPRAVLLAACSPFTVLAAAAGVSAAAVSTSGSTVAAGGGIAGITAVAAGVALLCAAAVIAYAWWLRPRPPATLLEPDVTARGLPEALTPVPSAVPVPDEDSSVTASEEQVTMEQAAESLSAAAMRVSMVLRQVNPNPGRGQDMPRSTAVADGSSSMLVTNLELSRFFDGGDGGGLVQVSVPAHGGGVVADGTELVSPRQPLRVRTQMDPAMRVAENLSAANLHFVELLRGKYLLPQLQATALRAANIVALRENVVPGDSNDGEICKVHTPDALDCYWPRSGRACAMHQRLC